MKWENSEKYRKAIHQLIPGGAHTYSKGDDQFPQISPAAIKSGKGAYVWDVDDNKFLDCSMGLTSVVLGHAISEVNEYVKKEIDNGVNFQRPSHLEKIVAEEFLSLIPQHQRIKFAKNGSSVTTAATKLARAYNGRKLIAFPGDHPFYSYDDWFISHTPCNKGIPEEIKDLSVTFNSNDLSTLENLFKKYPNQISCVISEPERPNCLGPGYVNKVIEICHKNGALFIQDEMISGFKTAFPGTITKYKTDADMATWGKSIANGFSFCALTGKAEIMDLGGIHIPGQEKVFLISSTHGGETSSIAACLATMDFIKKNDVIEHNQKIGQQLIDSCKAMIHNRNLDSHIDIVPCSWFVLFSFKDDLKKVSPEFRTLFLQEMIKNGVLFQGAFVPSFSHNQPEIELFMNAFSASCETYLKALKVGVGEYLIGPECKPVFRKFI